MLEWLKNLLPRKKEENEEYHVSEYSNVMFTIVERHANEPLWMIGLTLLLEENATTILLQPAFVNYVDAFMYLQGISSLFFGTVPDVTVFDKDANLIGRLDLSQPVPQNEPLIKTTHSPNYTIN